MGGAGGRFRVSYEYGWQNAGIRRIFRRFSAESGAKRDPTPLGKSRSIDRLAVQNRLADHFVGGGDPFQDILEAVFPERHHATRSSAIA